VCRITIIRVAIAAHLLVVIDRQPHTRRYRLDHGRQVATSALTLPADPDRLRPDTRDPHAFSAAPRQIVRG